MIRQNLFFVATIILASCSGKKEQSITMVAAPLASPADSLTAEPHLFTDNTGAVFMSWVEKQKDTSRFWYSRLTDEQWSSPALIAKGTSWFVNWADYPMMATDGQGNFVAHLLDKSGKGTYAYDVKVYTSNNKGASWNPPFKLNEDGKQAEHGFVTLVPYGDKVFVTWLDGRNTAMEGMEGMETMEHSGHQGAMSLRAAVMDYDGKKSGEWELDSKTCDCCQTTAAITDAGPIVVYRDRSDEEIRDMSIVRFVDGEWTEPKSIHGDNWKIAGCPVNGPRVAVLGNQVVVAWFSAATEPAHVNVVFSDDGGATFGEAVSIDEGKALGRVDVEWLDNRRAIVSWMEGTLIKAIVVHANGDKEVPITIAESSDARSSGFPQMTKSGDQLIFAWTDDQQKQVKVTRVRLGEIN